MKKEVLALALVFVMLTLTAAPALASAQVTKNEIVYATYDADGGNAAYSVVNRFEVGSAQQLTDYGVYQQVTNLTSTAPLRVSGDEISVQASAGVFYYEGVLSRAELPWLISVEYRLNGTPITPANLAGRSGPVEITLRVCRNTECTGDYFDHYALSITAAFDEKNCESIEAANGIVASVGSKKQVSFTVVPGSEADLTITMDAVQFAMDPISINGVPMSMDVGSTDITELKADMEDLEQGAELFRSLGEERAMALAGRLTQPQGERLLSALQGQEKVQGLTDPAALAAVWPSLTTDEQLMALAGLSSEAYATLWALLDGTTPSPSPDEALPGETDAPDMADPVYLADIWHTLTQQEQADVLGSLTSTQFVALWSLLDEPGGAASGEATPAPSDDGTDAEQTPAPQTETPQPAATPDGAFGETENDGAGGQMPGLQESTSEEEPETTDAPEADRTPVPEITDPAALAEIWFGMTPEEQLDAIRRLTTEQFAALQELLDRMKDEAAGIPSGGEQEDGEGGGEGPAGGEPGAAGTTEPGTPDSGVTAPERGTAAEETKRPEAQDTPEPEGGAAADETEQPAAADGDLPETEQGTAPMPGASGPHLPDRIAYPGTEATPSEGLPVPGALSEDSLTALSRLLKGGTP